MQEIRELQPHESAASACESAKEGDDELSDRDNVDDSNSNDDDENEDECVDGRSERCHAESPSPPAHLERRKQARRISGGLPAKKPYSPDSDDSNSALFHCPWPGCHKTFKRIKSRSAHLKWHGGDWRTLPQKQRETASWPPQVEEPKVLEVAQDTKTLQKGTTVLIENSDLDGIVSYRHGIVVSDGGDSMLEINTNNTVQTVPRGQVFENFRPEHQQVVEFPVIQLRDL